ncbi:MAG: GNAT family N-acetyltransferase [Saprospiraceae bacterium]
MEHLNLSPILLINYPTAAKLVATSFYDNPAHIYLCPNDATRQAQLEWLLGTNLKLQLKHGAESFCITEKEDTKAMGFWTKPNQIKVGLLPQIQGGLLKVPFKMGFSALSRVMEVSGGIAEHLTRTMGETQPYRYLNNMVIQEDMRGKGLGSSILQQQFTAFKTKEKDAIFALSTQRYRTVRFYEGLGFEVLLEEKIGKGALAFTNWTMRKE